MLAQFSQAYRNLSDTFMDQIAMHRAQASDEPGIALVPTDVNVATLAIMLTSALDIYDETVGHFLGHGGYPAMVWAEAVPGSAPAAWSPAEAAR